MMRRELFENGTLVKTEALGRNVIFLETVDSTNAFAKRMAYEGCPHGQLVVSEHQTAGRGRRGRGWSDEKEQSICMSVVLRPPVAAELAPRYPIAAALGICDAFVSLGIAAKIKWPNDLLYEEKKLSGILLEAGFCGGACFFVVGIGINVNQTSFHGEIKDTATSLRLAAGKELAREVVLSAALNAMEPVFSLCETDQGFKSILNRYAPASCTLKNTVDVMGVNGVFRGVAEALDGLGRLMVRTCDGALVTVNAGDVSVREAKEEQEG